MNGDCDLVQQRQPVQPTSFLRFGTFLALSRSAASSSKKGRPLSPVCGQCEPLLSGHSSPPGRCTMAVSCSMRCVSFGMAAASSYLSIFLYHRLILC